MAEPAQDAWPAKVAALQAELATARRTAREAVEQQTATAEIVRAISGSPRDAQPVFDIIAERATRLCDGLFGSVYVVRDETVHLVAHHGFGEASERWRRRFPHPLERSVLFTSAVRTATVQHVPDIDADGAIAPMIREGTVIGLIGVARTEARPFSDSQLALLATFADQAVLAIENVRLFTELQATNRDLTATGEILRAMSRSPTDPEPVFRAIVDSVAGLTGATIAGMFRFDGELLHFVAGRSPVPDAVEVYRQLFPRPLAPGTPVARAILERRVMHVPDVETEPSISPDARERFRAGGIRSNVQVPMIRHDVAIGLIGVGRSEPGPFSDKQIELLKTFADQAVIAIENVRLFTELQARTEALTRSVAELTALGDVSRALSSTLDLDTVLHTIVTRATELARTAGCTVWEYDAGREAFTLRAIHYTDAGDALAAGAANRVTTIPRRQGVTSRVMASRQPVQIPDITREGMDESPLRRALVDAGHRALLGVPLLSDDEVIGVLAVTRKAPGEFSPEIVALLTTFATQSALAIRNARLFRELEVKSRELAVASEHKSEFLAGMSHELRTPLNAIIGVSEILLEEAQDLDRADQIEPLERVLRAGRHLLALINDILDLSKIEAGRMELEVAAFDLPAVIDDALLLMRERAGRRGVTLSRHVDERLGEIHADQRKVKQVLLNLLSNAVKFTREGGRIDVRAGLTDAAAEISVTDTGVGIAPEHHEAVFEEFRQVGAAENKAQGTGLGLALCRRFVELHGGRIWVKSQPGVGSTFTFTVPSVSPPPGSA